MATTAKSASHRSRAFFASNKTTQGEEGIIRFPRFLGRLFAIQNELNAEKAVFRNKSWMHIIGFSLAIAMTIYVILDVEYPRIGFIRIDQTDQVLIDLRKSMN